MADDNVLGQLFGDVVEAGVKAGADAAKNAVKNGLDVLITNRGLTKLGSFFPAK